MNSPLASTDVMFDALVRKDRTFEGSFYAAVKTTGIFCRPSCTARKPKRENVEFFSTAKDALLHGYRPCKTCSPLTPLGTGPDHISRLIEELHAAPDLRIRDGDLRTRGIEPNALRRWFKRHHGITFHAFQRMLRINGAYRKLSDGSKVTRTAFESGYESLSGFTHAYQSILGNTPSHHEATCVINITRLSTPIGPVFACVANDALCLLEFTDRRMLEFELRQVQRLLKGRILYGDHALFPVIQQQLNEYFEGMRTKFDIPLAMPGTPFQMAVWKKLLDIPYGRTVSYTTQAIALNNPKAVRAVARANGFNRIAIIVPCHRVIGEDGHLTGYGGAGYGERNFCWTWRHTEMCGVREAKAGCAMSDIGCVM